MNKSNIFLLLIAIILATLLYYPSEPDNRQQRLSEIDSIQIESIHIVRSNLPDIHIKKQQQQWYLQSQPQQVANEKAVNKILELLQSSSYQQFSSKGHNLAEYGLEKPQTRIRFNDIEILFGKEEPLHSHRYVLYNQQIHLINNYYYYLLRSDSSRFVHEKETENHSG